MGGGDASFPALPPYFFFLSLFVVCEPCCRRHDREWEGPRRPVHAAQHGHRSRVGCGCLHHARRKAGRRVWTPRGPPPSPTRYCTRARARACARTAVAAVGTGGRGGGSRAAGRWRPRRWRSAGTAGAPPRPPPRHGSFPLGSGRVRATAAQQRCHCTRPAARVGRDAMPNSMPHRPWRRAAAPPSLPPLLGARTCHQHPWAASRRAPNARGQAKRPPQNMRAPPPRKHPSLPPPPCRGRSPVAQISNV